MSFQAERPLFAHELDSYYARYPSDLRALEQELHALSARHPDWLPCERKAMGYALLASRCAVKVFLHFPFYFELDTGRERMDLGTGGLGAWMKDEPFGRELRAGAGAWWTPCWESGLAVGWEVLDDNHHCIGNDNVFRDGLRGLLARAEARRAQVAGDRERAFLTGMIAGLRAQMLIADRFADEAARLCAVEDDPAIRLRLARMAETARRVPADPPATFYEGLCTLLFMREVTQGLEGNGISVLGHLDRILFPLYDADLRAGRITEAEARDLLGAFLAVHDVRFGMAAAPGWHVGTNTTVVIGGCDAEGTPIFNDLTRLIVECYLELRLVDPKLNARISPAHPYEYFALLARLIAAGGNALAIFNDDVVIAANVKMGKALADCRLYVGGGCQENLLENTEINSRASTYLNLAQVLLMGIFPEQYAFFTEREGIHPRRFAACDTFEGVYAACLDTLAAVTTALIRQWNRTEAEGGRYNPCPLHSATISDCIDHARDMMEGGARYSVGSIALTGIGTFIDALYAIREAVYTRRDLDWPRLTTALAADFAGEEALRQYLIRRIPKYGEEHEAIRAFSARVFADVARVASGHPNSRGGRYEASLFSFRTFADMGNHTAATPDGRHAGEHLTPGMSPNQPLLKDCSIGQVLAGLEPLDLTAYPVVAVLDVKLPLARGSYDPALLIPVLLRFLDAGGSVLQINAVDPAALLDARAHPERHRDLVVRVSGYSAYFTTLTANLQDEIIDRATVRV